MASEIKGLTGKLESEWPKFPAKAVGQRPIERLNPGSEEHKRVLEYLLERLRFSRQEMAKFHPRWRMNEEKIQAYINLPDWERELKAMNASGEPPAATRIVVPYSWATVATIVTYLMQVFVGRSPIFQVSCPQDSNAGMAMERYLQYNADHSKLIRHIYQFLLDTQYYNLAIFKCVWAKKQSLRTVWRANASFGPIQLGSKRRVRETVTSFEGSEVETVDPFMFYPDPRVPLWMVAKYGEFVFWETYKGLHTLKGLREFSYIDHIGTPPAGDRSEFRYGRAVKDHFDTSFIGGFAENNLSRYNLISQGSVEIIPAELGLGESDRPEKWIFAIANERQIIQAEPLGYDHGMHPVIVSSPYGGGYSFGSAGLMDMVAPMQDLMSWFVNAHIENVRTALNNIFIVDPSRVEMQDLERPGPGKIVRLKRAAMGTDAKSAIFQIPVNDVTSSHVNDMELLSRLADALTGVTDNLRGLQDHGGRKTATEVRTSTEAGTSRLANLARVISSEAITELASQMAYNAQQFVSEEFLQNVLGVDENGKSVRIHPEHITGDFQFPVNDGTLPIDRVAMLDVWREIYAAVSQDEALAQQYNRAGIFEHMAKLGGVSDLSRFKIQVVPDEIAAEGAATGELAPTGTLPGLDGSSPGNRMAGGL